MVLSRDTVLNRTDMVSTLTVFIVKKRRYNDVKAIGVQGYGEAQSSMKVHTAVSNLI